MIQAGGQPLDTTLVTDASAPAVARKAAVGFAGPADPDLVFRLCLLVSEAVSDRVLSHAVAAKPNGRVRVELSSLDHGVRGRVTDVGTSRGGAGHDPAIDMHDLEMGMMSALSDSWGTEREDDGAAAIWFAIEPGPAPTLDEYKRRFALALGR